MPKLCGQDFTEKRGRIRLKISYQQSTPVLGKLVVNGERVDFSVVKYADLQIC